jgi:hypothetical protein
MSVSLYDLTVPVFVRGLGILDVLLEKGRVHAEAEGIEPAALLEARLAPDMLTLVGQVQRASDTAKFTAVRIGGVENRSFPDEERSFADLRARIAATRYFLDAVPREAIEARAGDTINARIGRAELSIPAGDYALKFALPNFFFHVTTAYDVLRQKGVPVGKMDYIGEIG